MEISRVRFDILLFGQAKKTVIMDNNRNRVIAWVITAGGLSAAQVLSGATPLGCIVLGITWFILCLWFLAMILRLPARLETREADGVLSWIELFMDEALHDTQFILPILWLFTAMNSFDMARILLPQTQVVNILLFVTTPLAIVLSVLYKIAENRQQMDKQ